MQRVVHAVFFLFHFHFGSRAHFNHCHAAGQFGHTLLQFFFVVVAGGHVNLFADFSHACFNSGFVAVSVNNGGVFFGDFNAFGLTQVFQSCLFQSQADFFGNHGAAGQDGDVLQHGFAAVAKARCFHGHSFQNAANAIHHQSR